MKPRKLFVTLELDTDEHLKDLKSSTWWQDVMDEALKNVNNQVIQVQVNVSKKE